MKKAHRDSHSLAVAFHVGQLAVLSWGVLAGEAELAELLHSVHV